MYNTQSKLTRPMEKQDYVTQSPEKNSDMEMGRGDRDGGINRQDL